MAVGTIRNEYNKHDHLVSEFKDDADMIYTQGSQITISHSFQHEAIDDNNTWYSIKNQDGSGDLTGYGIWSGVVDTSDQVSAIKRKILVTADDIGIIPEVDDGAIELLKLGKINSLAVLVNSPYGNTSYLRSLKTRLESETSNLTGRPLIETTHLGLHLTITSGQPILNTHTKIVDKHGRFRSFKIIGKDYGRIGKVREYEAELKKQYEVFHSVFGKPSHLTSHHDVHSFYERLYYVTSKFIKQAPPGKDVPIRSYRFLPRWRRFMYDVGGVFPDIASIKQLDRWKNKLEREDNIVVRGPEQTYVGHYGPIPMDSYFSMRKAIKNKRKGLAKNMLHWKITRDEQREVMVHVIKSKIAGQNGFRNKYKAWLDAHYKGLDWKYFDSRIAEYRSLQKNAFWVADPEVEYLEKE